jgi:hypothetical protein
MTAKLSGATRARSHKFGSRPLRAESDRSRAAMQHVEMGQKRIRIGALGLALDADCTHDGREDLILNVIDEVTREFSLLYLICAPTCT